MKKNRFLQFIKKPNAVFCVAVWAVTVIACAGAVILAIVDIEGWQTYLVYVLAALLLAYGIYLIVRFAPDVKAACVRKIKKYKFTENLFTDYGYRTVAFAVGASAFNIVYAAFSTVLAVLSLSVWYGAISAYYFLLGLLRLGVLLGGNRIKKRCKDFPESLAIKKLKIYRNCGIALFVLEVALSAAVTQMVVFNRTTINGKIMAIASAAYTFTKVGFAVYNIFKARKLQDPLLQCFRNLNFTDAFVALLALQTTLITLNADMAANEMRILNAITGFVVCSMTIVMGIVMIVSATRKINRLSGESAGDAKQLSSAAENGCAQSAENGAAEGADKA